MNVIFLDCDGVLNHQFAKGNYSNSERFGLAEDLVDNLKYVIDNVCDVKIVISSSWRNFRVHEQVHDTINWRCILEHMLGKSNIIYGDLGTTNEFGYGGATGRVKDIQAWLNANKNLGIGTFVIIDDEASALKKTFPNNTVDCEISTYNGLTKAKAKEAIWILTNAGKDHNMNDNIWFVADTHFCHANIIRYCNRPFKDANEMDEALIANWNKTVGKDDIVWHLGDFAFGAKDNVTRILPRLNGKINLVLGNHDHQPYHFYIDAGFHRVYDRKVIINDYVILSHAPMMFNNANCPFFNIYGHVHDSEMFQTFTRTSCCACVERHGYKPISWKTIYEKYEEFNKHE